MSKHSAPSGLVTGFGLGAQPIARRFGVEMTVRPAPAFYHTVDEIVQLVEVFRRLSTQRRTG